MPRRPVAVVAATAVLAGALASIGMAQARPPQRDATAADASSTWSAAAGKGPVGGCKVFPANNYWNADISNLPVHPKSRQWMKHMSPSVDLHPDFGPSYGAEPVPYGIPITVVRGSHPKVRVRFHYAGESDKVRYPLGPDTKIEGGRGADGDRHAIIVDKSTCRLYETFDTRLVQGHWHAGSGAVWSLGGNRLRRNGWTSADAAGLPILPGLLRLREVESRHVNHAIRFTTNITDRRHIWPARHDAGSVSNRNYPPMGARFRLKAGFDMRGYRKDTKAVLRAMKTYGLVLADNGSPWYFQGESVKGWPSKLIEQLKTIPARAFVAVDTRPLMVRPGSAATH
jgi:hypothetical protein